MTMQKASNRSLNQKIAAFLVVQVSSLILTITPAKSLTAEPCEAALAVGAAYHNYEEVRQALVSGIAPATIPNAGCFLDGDLGKMDVDQAYRRFMSTSFQSNVLYDFLSDRFRIILEHDVQLGKKRGARLAWAGGYASEAAITAYRRTGETRFLDIFIAYFDGVLARRDDKLGYVDDYHKRVVRSWGSTNLDKHRWIAHVTHAARIVYPATEFAVLVKTDPALSRYIETANRFAMESKTALDEFEEDWRPAYEEPEWYWKIFGYQEGRSLGFSWYIRPDPGTYEATNHLHTVASVWVNLFKLNGDRKYKERSESVLQIFADGVTREPDGSVHWKYFPYFATKELVRPNGKQYSEPIWKASQTVPFLVRAAESGYPVSSDLLQAIARTFTDTVLRNDAVLKNLSSVESDDMDAKQDSNNLANLEGVVSWLEYDKIAPQIGEKLLDLVAARQDLFPRGWLSRENFARGYAHFLNPKAS
jgi:hypothetical protein